VVGQIWEDFLTIVRDEMGSRVVETWFKAVSLRQWDSENNVVYLEAPNSFVREWIKSNYMQMIQFQLGRLFNVHQLKIIFLEPSDQTSQDVPRHPFVADESKADNAHSFVPARSCNEDQSRALGPINKNYSFDSFVVGPHNALAYAAAYAVTERPGVVYNPLFICGRPGLGKTHLLQAIGNRMKTLHKKSMVLYQTTERFVNEFVHALRADKVQQFDTKYHQVDVLLMDDVQFIARKEQTQEAFFHIFNSLYNSHKQIVFSADSPPGEMKDLSEGLKSRLSGGLITDIEEPLMETKIAILKRKASLSEEDLNDDVAAFIASHGNGNIRELEGALVRVIAFASLTKQKVSIDLARKILARSHGALQHVQQVIDCETILRAVSRYYPYTVDEIRSKNRHKDISFVRHLSMFLMKKLTEKSLRDIGRLFGGRDHATVLHGLDKIERYVAGNPSIQHTIRQIEAEINKLA